VADGDVTVADHDLAHDESHDLLALLDHERLGVGREAGAEPVECFGELEVGSLGVVQLGVERVQLGANGCLAPAQFRGAGAKLIERDQLFLVAVDQPPCAFWPRAKSRSSRSRRWLAGCSARSV
jgi:hypothetical protein